MGLGAAHHSGRPNDPLPLPSYFFPEHVGAFLAARGLRVPSHLLTHSYPLAHYERMTEPFQQAAVRHAASLEYTDNLRDVIETILGDPRLVEPLNTLSLPNRIYGRIHAPLEDSLVFERDPSATDGGKLVPDTKSLAAYLLALAKAFAWRERSVREVALGVLEAVYNPDGLTPFGLLRFAISQAGGRTWLTTHPPMNRRPGFTYTPPEAHSLEDLSFQRRTNH